MSAATLLCILLLLASCSPRSGTETLQDRERYGSLQPGVSTKKDVYQRFGQPVEVLPVEGGSTWLYAQAPCPLGGSSRWHDGAVTLATFGFDDRDIYQRVNTTATAVPSRGKWHGWDAAGRCGGGACARGNAALWVAV